MDSLHEHFPQVRTSCTAVEPACHAAHRSSAPQKAHSVQLLDTLPKIVGFISLAHMGTTVTQEVSPMP